MTVFDTLRWPVTKEALCYGSLLDDIPTYLRNKWWTELKRSYGEYFGYVYHGETSDQMRAWLQSLNDTRVQRPIFMLKEMIAKYGE